MLREIIGLAPVAALAAVVGAGEARDPKPVPLLKQVRDGGPVTPLDPAELDTLGDPFYKLVLQHRPDAVSLRDIEALIQPEPRNRQLFVIDDQIADASMSQARHTARAVFTFTGAHRGQLLNPLVSLLAFYDAHAFRPGIEAWGWDEARGRYNFYGLHAAPPSGELSWTFRGSSADAERLDAAGREGTCFACHVNGAPVMRELSLPWAGWHSFKFQATYLMPTGDNRWPITREGPLALGPREAEHLEIDAIIPALTRFNVRRIADAAHPASADGRPVSAPTRLRVASARRLLRPLFVTTEVNIGSSPQRSGLHPLDARGGGPPEAVAIPNTFFLNADVIVGGTLANFTGLGVGRAQQFERLAILQPHEYRQLVVESDVRVGDARPADALFSWVTPVPSQIDNDLIDRLLRRGVVTPEFVAAVMAVDVETPVLSAARAALVAYLPEEFTFEPISLDTLPLLVPSRHPDDLTGRVIRALIAARPAPGTSAADFLDLLRHPDPRRILSERVEGYYVRLRTRLQDPERRPAELKRLYELALGRRAAVADHPVLRAIVRRRPAFDPTLVFPLP